MGPLDVLRTSPLVDEMGWVDVHPKTMQHKKYSKSVACNGAAV